MKGRDCTNCHYFSINNDPASTEKCFGGTAFCIENPNRPNWQHVTRADVIRTKSDLDLARFLAACVNGTPGQWLTWLKEDYE